jgi:hypothetical protein
MSICEYRVETLLELMLSSPDAKPGALLCGYGPVSPYSVTPNSSSIGTYFPRPRFTTLLRQIRGLWEDDRQRCVDMGKGVIEQLKDMGSGVSLPYLSLRLTNPSHHLGSPSP